MDGHEGVGPGGQGGKRRRRRQERGAAGRGMEEGGRRMLSAQCDKIIRSMLALQGKQSLPEGS